MAVVTDGSVSNREVPLMLRPFSVVIAFVAIFLGLVGGAPQAQADYLTQSSWINQVGNHLDTGDANIDAIRVAMDGTGTYKGIEARLSEPLVDPRFYIGIKLPGSPTTGTPSIGYDGGSLGLPDVTYMILYTYGTAGLQFSLADYRDGGLFGIDVQVLTDPTDNTMLIGNVALQPSSFNPPPQQVVDDVAGFFRTPGVQIDLALHGVNGFSSVSAPVTFIRAVPEPSSILLLAIGGVFIAANLRRKAVLSS